MSNKSKNTTVLKVGDAIRWDGDFCLITAVSENAARSVGSSGIVELVPNPIKTLFIEQPGEKDYENFMKINPERRKELEAAIPEEQDAVMASVDGIKQAYHVGTKRTRAEEGSDKIVPKDEPKAKDDAKTEAQPKAKGTSKGKEQEKTAAASEKATEKAKGSGKGLGKLFGASPVAVVRSLGRAGAEFDAVKAGMAKLGFQLAEGTLRANWRTGKAKAKDFSYAELNKQQLKQFGL